MLVINSMSSHPEGSLLRSKRTFDYPLTTRKRSPKGSRSCGAGRRKSPNISRFGLARAWRATPDCPPWARKHSASAWAALLAAPARHGWTARDLTQLVTDWLGITGRTIPDAPYRPIGLMGAILAWHGARTSTIVPQRLREAREAAEVAAAHASGPSAHRAHPTCRAGFGRRWSDRCPCGRDRSCAQRRPQAHRRGRAPTGGTTGRCAPHRGRTD